MAARGLMKPLRLSPELSKVLGKTQESRPQVVKQLWAVIKARGLQDPANKREILTAGNELAPLFPEHPERINMFTMQKELSKHLFKM